MAGRPRKPTATKRAQGTLRKHRENPEEPKFKSLEKLPPPPKDLNKHGQKLWAVGNELVETGVLTAPDLHLFEKMCRSFQRYIELADYIETDLLNNIANKKGGRSPQAQQMNAEMVYLEKTMSHFGLTPASRSKLGVTKKKEDDLDTKKMKELLGV